MKEHGLTRSTAEPKEVEFTESKVFVATDIEQITVTMDEQEVHEYKKGSVLKIPFKTKMNVGNKHDEILELIVVKAPASVK